MQKTYFHDRKHISEKKINKKTIPLQYTDQKRIVDINKLLNRVKLEKKTEITQKIIYYSLTISLICLMGAFIAFVR